MCHILVIHNSFANNSGIQLRSTMWSKLITRVPINNKRVRMRSNLKRHHKYISVQFMCSGGKIIWSPTATNLLVCSHPKKWTVSRQNIIQKSRENTLYKSYKLIESLSEICIWSPTTQSEFWHIFWTFMEWLIFLHYIMMFKIKTTMLLFCMDFYFHIKFRKFLRISLGFRSNSFMLYNDT